jgi:hypothetical protein
LTFEKYLSMKKTFFIVPMLFLAVVTAFNACTKEEAVAVPVDHSFSENFDSVRNAVAKGWVLANNTKPIGTYGWVQGYFYFSLYHGYEPGKTGGPRNYAFATGLSGNPNSPGGKDFIMSTADCGAGVAHISNWIISPEVVIKNGDKIRFYTRTFSNPAAGADRLEVRINPTNSSASVGRDAESIGGFSKVILDINPTYELGGDEGYPGFWEPYEVVITDMPVARKSRIAFRYHVPNGGPLGENSIGIGIDAFEFIAR